MRHFEFEDRVKLNCRVTNVSRASQSAGHIVTYTDSNAETREILADFVAVCSGLHVTPAWPGIPGIEYVLSPKSPPASPPDSNSIPHEVYHSSEYNGRHQLAGRSVLILGTGETGHDLAYEAAKAGATQVTLCTRGPSLSHLDVLPRLRLMEHRRIPVIPKGPRKHIHYRYFHCC